MGEVEYCAWDREAKIKAKYLIVSTDYGIESKHREKKPADNVMMSSEHYLDPHYKVCLNCSLEKCWRDDARDDKRQVLPLKKLCPIEISKNGK